jgi:hypothetical protein
MIPQHSDPNDRADHGRGNKPIHQAAPRSAIQGYLAATAAAISVIERDLHRHHLSATLLDGRAGNGWARLLPSVAIGRTAGLRMLVMSRIRHAAIVP